MDVANIGARTLNSVNPSEIGKTDDKAGEFKGRTVEPSKKDSDDRSVQESFSKSLEAPSQSNETPILNRTMTKTVAPEMKETNVLDGFVMVEDETADNIQQNTGKVEIQNQFDGWNVYDDDPQEVNGGSKTGQNPPVQENAADQEAFEFVRDYRDLKPHTSSVASTVGRFFQAIGLFLRSIFVSDVKVDDAADTDFIKNDYNPAGERMDSDEPVAYSKDTIGLAMGLKGEVRVKKFEGGLYPKNGHPSLSDIKQNPDLQDCWFLSSVTALLASKGTKFIEDMIEHRDGDDFAIVHFKHKSYKVPYGELTDGDNHVSVSNSAPWVKLLETAMQMHLIQKCKGEGGGPLSMANRDIGVGLTALTGTFSRYEPPANATDKTAVLTVLKNKLTDHQPVVLGHNVGFLHVFDFVAVKHAVTLLDVNPDKKEVTIMDPYGRILVKDADFLDRCSVHSSSGWN